MASRLTAFLLMLVLVCAGFFGSEPIGTTPPADAVALEQVAVGDEADPGGSDPYPADPAAQTPAEGVHDLPALIMASAPTPDAGLTMAAPPVIAERTPLAPYLDGPQRPPRATGSPR